jgi:hypothetical protein
MTGSAGLTTRDEDAPAARERRRKPPTEAAYRAYAMSERIVSI